MNKVWGDGEGHLEREWYSQYVALDVNGSIYLLEKSERSSQNEPPFLPWQQRKSKPTLAE